MNDENENERSESDGELLARMGTDAAVWADELVKHASVAADLEGTTLAELLADPEPGGFLHGWLCNAIGAGETAGASRANAEVVRGLPPMVRLMCAYPGSAAGSVS